MLELRELDIFEHLENKKIPNFASLKHLRTLKVRGRRFSSSPKYSTSLEYLKIRDDDYGTVPHVFDGLASTRIRRLHLSANHARMQFPQLPESLEQLRMIHCRFGREMSQASYQHELRSLKIVDLTGCHLVEMSIITEWLSQTNARLSHLSLAYCNFTRVTSNAIRDLITYIN